jgi:homoserine dehydrogenase
MLHGPYVFRTEATIPGSTFYEPGAVIVKDLTAVQARALLDEALKSDPTTFMAAVSATS